MTYKVTGSRYKILSLLASHSEPVYSGVVHEAVPDITRIGMLQDLRRFKREGLVRGVKVGGVCLWSITEAGRDWLRNEVRY